MVNRAVRNRSHGSGNLALRFKRYVIMGAFRRYVLKILGTQAQSLHSVCNNRWMHNAQDGGLFHLQKVPKSRIIFSPEAAVLAGFSQTICMALLDAHGMSCHWLVECRLCRLMSAHSSRSPPFGCRWSQSWFLQGEKDICIFLNSSLNKQYHSCRKMFLKGWSH